MCEHDENVLNIDTINIIAQVPVNTSHLTLTAQYFDGDGSPVKVESVMNASDLYRARKDFLDNVEGGDDYNAVYVITDKGRRWLEEMELRIKNGENGDENF